MEEEVKNGGGGGGGDNGRGDGKDHGATHTQSSDELMMAMKRAASLTLATAGMHQAREAAQ